MLELRRKSGIVWLALVSAVVVVAGVARATERHVPSQYPTIAAAVGDPEVVSGDEV